MYQGRADIGSSSAKRSLATDFRNLQAPRRLADEPTFRSRDEGKQGIQLQHRLVLPGHSLL